MDIESAKTKSQILQTVLISIAGPLGLFYSNWRLAVLLLITALVLAGAFLFPAFLTWPLSWIAGYYSVKKHNRLANAYISLRKRQSNVGTLQNA